MKIMTWDAALAAQAQKWANTCTFEHSPDSQRPIASGENLYQSFSQGSQGPPKNVGVAASKDWAKERFLITGTERLIPFVFGSDIGHWTQMIWANTNKIGCGAIKFSEGKGKGKVIVVCQYAPPGNFGCCPAQNTFDVGAACQGCTDGCSSNNQLCN